MTGPSTHVTKSGVRIAGDFRDNLIIDRYAPVILGMRASKLKHLCSENSEDAVSWNVFRSWRRSSRALGFPNLPDVGFQE